MKDPGYIFHCSKCKFDHAGECEVRFSFHVDTDAANRAREQVSYIGKMISDLEAQGWKKTTYLDSRIVFTKNIKLQQPLTFIPITFKISDGK